MERSRPSTWRCANSFGSGAATLANKVESLLNFHQQILEQASILAFRPHGRRCAEVVARLGSGESESSRRLERLAAEC